ncbi:sigma-70 family RNA polymerase sigma factor [Kineosporia babensis]|uniref:Sigma-70 family RNA polymerase sigma factor n=1 Tax=Kineosporia babensis TaxID=499548 RepID=A0A9X1NCA3_9ACTN|nr:sigma-70 family RNA polymerase sigma factor [Kineosporia babensis]MCD5310641.1 sigma-70 family RNA polymerase sigma factor [Kineosporia babensis]
MQKRTEIQPVRPPAGVVAIGPSPQEQRFVDLVLAHRPGLLTYATRLVGGDARQAEDLVQETFLRAWQRIDQLTPENGSVIFWLRRVAGNLAIDRYRMRQARPAETELLPQDYPVRSDGTDQIVAGVMLNDLLDTIQPDHRAVVEEVYLRDRTIAQAAQALGVPAGTVKSRLFYALRKLRDSAQENELQQAC